MTSYIPKDVITQCERDIEAKLVRMDTLAAKHDSENQQ